MYIVYSLEYDYDKSTLFYAILRGTFNLARFLGNHFSYPPRAPPFSLVYDNKLERTGKRKD